MLPPSLPLSESLSSIWRAGQRAPSSFLRGVTILSSYRDLCDFASSFRNRLRDSSDAEGCDARHSVHCLLPPAAPGSMNGRAGFPERARKEKGMFRRRRYTCQPASARAAPPSGRSGLLLVAPMQVVVVVVVQDFICETAWNGIQIRRRTHAHAHTGAQCLERYRNCLLRPSCVHQGGMNERRDIYVSLPSNKVQRTRLHRIGCECIAF